MEQFLWTEIYRPKSVKDTILPDNMKSVFQSFVDDACCNCTISFASFDAPCLPTMYNCGHAGPVRGSDLAPKIFLLIARVFF